MAKRARECSFEDLSTSQVPYVYVNKRRGPSFSDFTDFSWVHHVPLFIPTKEYSTFSRPAKAEAKAARKANVKNNFMFLRFIG